MSQPAAILADRLDWRVMTPIFAITAVDAIGVGVILPLLPFYSTHFGASAFMVGLLFAAFSLCQFLGAPWLGRLSDRYGRRPILLLSQLGTLVSLVLLAQAQSLWMLFAARALDGLTAGNMSVVAAASADHSTPATRRQAMGVVSAAVGVGLVIGPALPALLPFTSLSAPIWAAAVLSAASMTLTWLWFPHSEAKSGAATRPALGPASLWKVVSSPATVLILAALAAFYLMGGMYVSQFALFAHGRYLYQGAPLGPRQIAWAFAAVGAINIFTQLFALRRLGHLLSDKEIAILSHSLIIAGFIVLAIGSGLVELGCAVVLIGFGNALTRPVLSAALSLSTPASQQGAVMGLNQSLMAVCSVVAPPVAGLLIAQGLYVTWALAAAVLVALGLTLTLLLFARRLWPSPQPAPGQVQPT